MDADSVCKDIRRQMDKINTRTACRNALLADSTRMNAIVFAHDAADRAVQYLYSLISEPGVRSCVISALNLEQECDL